MKYKCDMVKDLMPLCVDKAASEGSEQVVIEHLAECNECMEYYNTLEKDIFTTETMKEPERKYSILAKKIRKRNIIVRTAITFLIAVILTLSVNYASGYRVNPQNAADQSGRLNYKSQVIGSYDWNNWKFYIYDSYSCYDVVMVKKTWKGWKVTDTCLNWPKWLDEKIGIEMAGALLFVEYDKGIQLFPFIVNDIQIKSVDVTIFGETKKTLVESTGLQIVTFDVPEGFSNENIVATAYNESGKPLYTLDQQGGYWIWVPIEEE